MSVAKEERNELENLLLLRPSTQTCQPLAGEMGMTSDRGALASPALWIFGWGLL